MHFASILTFLAFFRPDGVFSFTNRFVKFGLAKSLLLRDVPVELTGQLNPANSWVVKVVNGDEVKEILIAEDCTILEAAEKVWDEVPSSCRTGVCSTCCARVIEGFDQVKIAVTGINEDIVSKGFVCSCQTYPTGPGIVIKLNQSDEVYEEQYGKYEQSYEMKFSNHKGDIKNSGISLR